MSLPKFNKYLVKFAVSTYEDQSLKSWELQVPLKKAMAPSYSKKKKKNACKMFTYNFQRFRCPLKTPSQ